MKGGAIPVAFLLLAAGCALAPAGPLAPPRDVDPAPYWAALARGDRAAARAVAEELGWERAGSVEGERLRQRLLVEEGRRGEAVARVRAWLAVEPRSPDLLYLEARLLQNPARQARRFATLARRFPRHAWIRLGAASLALDAGRLEEARRHLAAAPPWPDAVDFRVRVEARLLAARGRTREALARLEPAAFVLGDLGALQDHLRLAAAGGELAEARRSLTALDLRSLPLEAGVAERVDAVAARLQAEIAAGRLRGLEEAAGFLDRCCYLAGLPVGWTAWPRLEVPMVAGLLRVEEPAAEPARTWALAGRRLVLGRAPIVGLEALLLQDVRSRVLDLPGLGRAEVLLAARASSRDGLSGFVGAAVLAGFFVRLDRARQLAGSVLRTVAAVDPGVEPVLPEGPDPPGGSLPEDWDLAPRLWARLLAAPGAEAERLSLEATWFHEAGHLPETLPWFQGRRSPLADLPRFLGSLLLRGDPLEWLEYRAQLRALAAAPDPRWLLAEVAVKAHDGQGRYPRAFRHLLRDLVAAGRDLGLPPLPRWHRLAPEEVRALAREVLARRGLEPLDEEAAALLAATLRELAAELPPEPATPGPESLLKD